MDMLNHCFDDGVLHAAQFMGGFFCCCFLDHRLNFFLHGKERERVKEKQIQHIKNEHIAENEVA